MPATSASGERLIERSPIERPGSPSKSMNTTSRPVHSACPRWRSPWTRVRAASSLRVRSTSNDPSSVSPCSSRATAAGSASAGSDARLRRTARCVSRSDGPQALHDRALPQQREPLGLERRRAAGQVQVHLRRALAEELGDGLEHGLVAGRLGLGDEALDVARQQVLAPLPQVGLVADGVVDDHHVAGGLAADGDVERAGDAGHPVEAHRPQVQRQRHVGVLARRQLADQLGDDPAADDHRRVRLLDAEDVDVARVGGQLRQPGPAGVAGGDGAAAAPGPPAQGGLGDDAGALGQRHGVDDGAVVGRARAGRRASAGRPRRRAPRDDAHQRHRVLVVVALGERRAHDEQGDVGATARRCRRS